MMGMGTQDGDENEERMGLGDGDEDEDRDRRGMMGIEDRDGNKHGDRGEISVRIEMGVRDEDGTGVMESGTGIGMRIGIQRTGIGME